jgi:hypothetical protein
MDLCQQLPAQDAMIFACLHPGPTITNDVSTRGIKVGGHVYCIMLTLFSQGISHDSNHCIGIDLTGSQGIWID